MVGVKYFSPIAESLFQCDNLIDENFVFVDPNCIQILAPTEIRPDKGDNFAPGQHMGHVSKDCASILAHLMDEGYRCESVVGDDYAYLSGFVVVCTLSSTNSNRSAAGYPIDIVFFSNNSAKWVHCLADFLRSSNFVPVIFKWCVYQITKKLSFIIIYCNSVGYDEKLIKLLNKFIK